MYFLCRYLLQHHLRSQRFFAPMVIYVTTVLLFYSYKPNPIADSYSVTAMLLFWGAAWLGLMVMNTEPAGQMQLLIVHTGSKRKIAAGQIICAWIMALSLTVFTVLYPVLFGMFDRRPTANEWIMTWSGHLVLSMLGISIAVFFQKSYISKVSRSMPALIMVLIISFIQVSLAEQLPEALRWITGILPPAFYLVQEMMNSETMMQSSYFGIVIWNMVYAVVLLLIHFGWLNRREIRS
ncbi:hypothetical protein PAECIP112173_00752 [Paenibacillus sp. JJ-100]|uniref:hypothetical protein n=1 Tax=Paenibacillus sp. JJ-100 TaxID=2974896 RepID=UPI0022FFA4A7|nr:hypothetical protein [Paenibacillus sp. JJ-100]CAI6034152.1 hypothetical protein PAECIP112173_00752 [Paenibacillus sp. JJ-100]